MTAYSPGIQLRADELAHVISTSKLARPTDFESSILNGFFILNLPFYPNTGKSRNFETKYSSNRRRRRRKHPTETRRGTLVAIIYQTSRQSQLSLPAWDPSDPPQPPRRARRSRDDATQDTITIWQGK